MHITEMTVAVSVPPSAADLARQANVSGDMLAVCMRAASCTSFATWGLTDRYSFVPPATATTGRGSLLVLDESFRPKPAYQVLQQELIGP